MPVVFNAVKTRLGVAALGIFMSYPSLSNTYAIIDVVFCAVSLVAKKKKPHGLT